MKYAKKSGYEQTLLGELLMRRGHVRRARIEQALRIQKTTRQRLGEVLVGRGWLSEEHLQGALRLQRRLRRALGVVSLAGLPMLGWADEGACRCVPLAGSVGLATLDEQEMREASATGLEAGSRDSDLAIVAALERERPVEAAAFTKATFIQNRRESVQLPRPAATALPVAQLMENLMRLPAGIGGDFVVEGMSLNVQAVTVDLRLPAH